MTYIINVFLSEHLKKINFKISGIKIDFYYWIIKCNINWFSITATNFIVFKSK